MGICEIGCCSHLNLDSESQLNFGFRRYLSCCSLLIFVSRVSTPTLGGELIYLILTTEQWLEINKNSEAMPQNIENLILKMKV